MARANGHQTCQAAAKGDKAQSPGEDGENIWSSLLDSVASGKHLPEKTLIVLGMAPFDRLRGGSDLTIRQEERQRSRKNFSKR
jgi:hypothetical protein